MSLLLPNFATEKTIKQMKKKNIITALLVLVALTALGQETKKEKKATECNIQIGISVKDHLTHEKVPNLKGELLLAADSSHRQSDSPDFRCFHLLYRFFGC